MGYYSDTTYGALLCSMLLRFYFQRYVDSYYDDIATVLTNTQETFEELIDEQNKIFQSAIDDLTQMVESTSMDGDFVK